MDRYLPSGFRRMAAGGAGQIASFIILILLPFIGRAFLNDGQFAIWAILSSVATLTVSLDLGGSALVTSQLVHARSRRKLILQGCLLSSAGTVAIGVVAGLAWWPYSHTAAASDWSLGRGWLALGAVTVAGAARSSNVVLAAAALVHGDYRTRNVLLSGQAFAAVALAFVFLATGLGVWSLPLAWLVSAPILTAIGWRQVARATQGDLYLGVPQPATERYSLRTYVGARTVVTLIGSFLTQADRWVVGAAGGPHALADYELAWRAAAVPRLVVQSLAFSLVADAANLDERDPRAPGLLLRRSLRYVSRALGVLTIGVVVVAGVASVETTWSMRLWAFVAMLTVAFNVNALTAPISCIGIGMNRPWIDVPYLIVTGTLVAVAWTLGVLLQSPYLAIGLSSGVLVLTSLGFLLTGQRAFPLQAPTP